jgi:hypothetical protein
MRPVWQARGRVPGGPITRVWRHTTRVVDPRILAGVTALIVAAELAVAGYLLGERSGPGEGDITSTRQWYFDQAFADARQAALARGEERGVEAGTRAGERAARKAGAAAGSRVGADAVAAEQAAIAAAIAAAERAERRAARRAERAAAADAASEPAPPTTTAPAPAPASPAPAPAPAEPCFDPAGLPC